MTTRTIKLDKEYELGGKKHPIGTELTLHEKLVDWLVRQNMGHEMPNGNAPRPAISNRRSSCCGRK